MDVVRRLILRKHRGNKTWYIRKKKKWSAAVVERALISCWRWHLAILMLMSFFVCFLPFSVSRLKVDLHIV